MYVLDHIVHFVDKPEKFVEETKNIGLYTVQGGKHEMWGTYNSLSYFGLSYIEFIGVFNQELLEESARKPFTLHDSYKKRNYKNGLTRLALRTNTIEQDAKRLKKAGFIVDGVQDFSRTRPDGSVTKWKLLHFGKDNLPVDFPFLIQWEGTDEERVKELTALNIIGDHPLGDLKLKEIKYSVQDLKIAKEWADVFNFNFEENEGYIELITPNCLITFYKSNHNEMIEVVITNSKETKEVEIGDGLYKFVK